MTAQAESRKAERRQLNPISLSFLDVMSCGFGAVVLLFLIIDHSTSTYREVNPGVVAEVNLLQEDIRQGQENMVRIRNTISDVDLQIVEAQGLARSIEEEIETFLAELQRIEAENNTSDDDLQSIREQIAAMEVELTELRESGTEDAGNNIREFIGDGNRQYLTGMLMGGNRILILVDISGSMLDDTIVNIIRRRNMSEAQQRKSEKWVRVLNTVDWLTAQMPVPSRYQIYLFNNEVRSLVPNTEGTWLEVADDTQLNQAVEDLHQNIVPREGTNLINLFTSIQALNPLPDNIYLITDGLPTLDNSGSRRRTISGSDRERLFERALRELPSGIPVNVIMMPLEGDPMAASYYWQLAISTGGSFMNPSEDWP